MGQDYLNEVRQNLNAAALRKQAERRAEAKDQRAAKIGLITFLVVIFAVVAIFGNGIV